MARADLEASDTVDTLVFDLLEWIGPDARPYDEVMQAWRTSCPRLPVWEEACERGYIARRHDAQRGALICVSTLGSKQLRARRGVTG